MRELIGLGMGNSRNPILKRLNGSMEDLAITTDPILKISRFQLCSFDLKSKVLNESLCLFPNGQHPDLHLGAFGFELLVGKGEFGIDLLEVVDGVRL